MNDRLQRKIKNLESIQRFPAEELFSYFPIKKADTILDLGAGTGYIARCIATKVKKVFAFDADQDILDYLRKISDESEIDNIETIVGDFKEIHLPENQIDTAIASISLHEVKPLSTVLDELKRVLKQGGLFVCVEIEKTEHASGPRVSSVEMETEMSNAGFTIVEKAFPATKLGNEPLYILVGRKKE
ncbi:class I SAM-dependent methyltransferase [Shouchella sp. 1P09AA]|uniref:class I SAM-dependent methyltransferase n=1 Tax=unclassified Shouchella TaxID=2893065 RepID=UPI0039A25C8F